MNRLPTAVLLTIGLTSLGFGVGGGVSAELIAGSGSGGLDGAATVAVCALGGAIVGFILAIVLALRLALPQLVRSAIIALVLGPAAIGLFVWRGTQRGKQAGGITASAVDLPACRSAVSSCDRF